MKRLTGNNMQSPFISERALANTYASRSYNTAYQRVVLYRKAQRAKTRHPDKGSQALATQLGVDRNAIREWVDGDSVPNPVRAIQTADRRGWLDLDYDSPAFEPLNRLVAWVFSGGSIDTERNVPVFVINASSDADALQADLDALGVGYTAAHADDPDRSTEIQPAEDAAVLGRVLSILGAPVGSKSGTDISLPAYLKDAPTNIRREFVDVYLSNRGQRHPDKATMTLRETRSQQYLNDLAALFEDVAGAPVNVSEQNVILSADATRALDNQLGEPTK